MKPIPGHDGDADDYKVQEVWMPFRQFAAINPKAALELAPKSDDAMVRIRDGKAELIL
jgi:hypothetical protein